MKSPTVEQVVAVFLLLLNSVVFVEARRLWSSTEYEGLGPGIYLAILGFLLLIFNLIYVVSEFTQGGAGQKIGEVFGRESARTGIAVTLMIGHATLTPIMGFLGTTVVFLVLFFRLLSGYTIKRSVLLGVALAAVLHVAFVSIFRVPLPTSSFGI